MSLILRVSNDEHEQYLLEDSSSSSIGSSSGSSSDSCPTHVIAVETLSQSTTYVSVGDLRNRMVVITLDAQTRYQIQYTARRVFLASVTSVFTGLLFMWLGGFLGMEEGTDEHSSWKAGVAWGAGIGGTGVLLVVASVALHVWKKKVLDKRAETLIRQREEEILAPLRTLGDSKPLPKATLLVCFPLFDDEKLVKMSYEQVKDCFAEHEGLVKTRVEAAKFSDEQNFIWRKVVHIRQLNEGSLINAFGLPGFSNLLRTPGMLRAIEENLDSDRQTDLVMQSLSLAHERSLEEVQEPQELEVGISGANSPACSSSASASQDLVTITLGDNSTVELPRAALIEGSKYLSRLLAGGMKEDGATAVSLTEPDPQMLKFVLDIINGGEVVFEMSRMRELLEVQAYLGTEPLLEQTTDYLKTQLNTDNYQALYALGKDYSLEPLQKEACGCAAYVLYHEDLDGQPFASALEFCLENEMTDLLPGVRRHYIELLHNHTPHFGYPNNLKRIEAASHKLGEPVLGIYQTCVAIWMAQLIEGPRKLELWWNAAAKIESSLLKAAIAAVAKQHLQWVKDADWLVPPEELSKLIQTI